MPMALLSVGGNLGVVVVLSNIISSFPPLATLAAALLFLLCLFNH